LAYYGFVSGAETQAESAVSGIRLASSFLPGVMIIMGAIPLFFLPINKRVEKELSDFSIEMHRSSQDESDITPVLEI
jgi:Na+/melibiose symporter-like transporter